MNGNERGCECESERGSTSLRHALDRRLEPGAAARQRHAVARPLLVVEHDGRGQVADVAPERAGELAGQRDRARGLLGRAEAAHSPAWIGVPPCARMRDAKIAALRAPPTAMQPTGTPGGICEIASSASMPPRPPEAIGTPITGSSV